MKILIINVTRIGDTLFGVPSIRAIAQHYPGAEITVLAHPNRYEVLEHLPYVQHAGGITEKSCLVSRWSGKQYDKAFVWGFDAPLIRYAARVSKEVIAHRQPDAAVNKLIDHIVDPLRHKANHVVKQLLTLPEKVWASPPQTTVLI